MEYIVRVDIDEVEKLADLIGGFNISDIELKTSDSPDEAIGIIDISEDEIVILKLTLRTFKYQEIAPGQLPFYDYLKVYGNRRLLRSI